MMSVHVAAFSGFLISCFPAYFFIVYDYIAQNPKLIKIEISFFFVYIIFDFAS